MGKSALYLNRQSTDSLIIDLCNKEFTSEHSQSLYTYMYPAIPPYNYSSKQWSNLVFSAGFYFTRMVPIQGTFCLSYPNLWHPAVEEVVTNKYSTPQLHLTVQKRSYNSKHTYVYNIIYNVWGMYTFIKSSTCPSMERGRPFDLGYFPCSLSSMSRTIFTA